MPRRKRLDDFPASTVFRLTVDAHFGDVSLWADDELIGHWEHPADVDPYQIPDSLQDELEQIQADALDWFDPAEEAIRAYDSTRGVP